MRRVLVVGMSGAGKTTVARSLARRWDLPYHEMDALVHGPGWTVRPSLLDDVAAIVAQDRWIFDSWGYPPPVRELLWNAADGVVWLDYSRRVIMPRVLRRSLRRTVRREVVFGGNRETWRGWLTAEHPAWHALTNVGRRRVTIGSLVEHHRPATVVRLRDPRATDDWLADVSDGNRSAR